MIRAGCVVAVQILVLSAGLWAAEAESKPDPKIVKNFKVQWSSVRYDKSVVVENPELPKGSQGNSEGLTLTCQVEVRDPNLILGIAQGAVITQLIDSEGRNVAIGMPAINMFERYEAPRYQPQFRQTNLLPKWRSVVRTILQRPPQRLGPPQLVMELRPSQLTARLDLGLLDQAGGEIRSVKGYFHALAPGSTEYVEVPFEPNQAWVRLTPDTEIQVQEADQGNRSSRFRINVRPQMMQIMDHMRSFRVGEPVPARFVAGREFIGEDGKPIRQFTGLSRLPAPVAGGGNVGNNGIRIRTIRFAIAVDTKECRIPFELQRVPLPKP